MMRVLGCIWGGAWRETYSGSIRPQVESSRRNTSLTDQTLASRWMALRATRRARRRVRLPRTKDRPGTERIFPFDASRRHKEEETARVFPGDDVVAFRATRPSVPRSPYLAVAGGMPTPVAG